MFNGLHTSSRSRSLRRDGRLASGQRHKASEVHHRRRVYRLRKELARERASSRRTRAEIHRERDESQPQLRTWTQRGIRDWGDKNFRYTFRSRSPSEMAREIEWAEGFKGRSTEESFKRHREEVISWIKGYPSKCGCPTNTGPLYGWEDTSMKKRDKNKQGTAGPVSYSASQDTYIHNFTDMFKNEDGKNNRVPLSTFARIKSFVLRLLRKVLRPKS